MEVIRKRIQAVLILVCTLLFAGCSGKAKSENMEWRMKDCEIEGLEGAVMEIARISGQEFYVTSGIVFEDELSEKIYYVNLSTKQAERIPIPLDKNEYITDIVSLGDNGFAAFLSERDEEVDLRKHTLITADRTGKVLSKRNISDITGGEEVLRLLAAADGKILPVTAGCVYCLDENLNDINKYGTAAQVEDAVLVEGERVVCLCADDREGENAKVRFCRLNLTKGIWEKDFTVKLDSYEPVTRLVNGWGSSFFLFSTKGIYECEESGRSNFVLRFGEQKLAEDVWSYLTVLPEGGFLSCENDYDNFCSTIGLLSLEEMDEQQVQIVIGGVGMAENYIDSKLLQYNQTNPDIKVKLKEYEFDGDSTVSYFDACSRLYADILAGNGPDIIYMQGLDCQNLIKMGYLENLDAYYEKDAELSKEDLIPSLREAISVEGSLYYLSPEFTLETLVGKTSLVGDSMGWTMKELYDLWEKKGYEILPWGNQTAFYFLSKGLVQDENADMGDYRRALEMTKREGADLYATERNAGLKKDQVLLAYCGMTQPIVIQLMHSLFDEAEITFKGFPGVEGSGALFALENAMGISSQSKHKEEAWDVIRSMMTKEYQSVAAGNVSYFPTRLDCFEETLLEYTKDKSEYNFWLGMELNYFEDKIIVTALSDEDVQRIKELVFETEQVDYNDPTIADIVNEEANAYFSGDRDLEAVCELIRNRIELYRKEE